MNGKVKLKNGKVYKIYSTRSTYNNEEIVNTNPHVRQ